MASSPRRARIKWIILGIMATALAGLATAFFLWPTASPELRAAKRLDCWGVGGCADDCSIRCPDDLKKYPCMLSCKERCEKRGCAGAAALHDQVASCAQKHCLFRCIRGPTPQCKSCTLQRCVSESARCQKHRCPDGR